MVSQSRITVNTMILGMCRDFAINYDAVKQTFYVPDVSQQFVTEMSERNV